MLDQAAQRKTRHVPFFAFLISEHLHFHSNSAKSLRDGDHDDHPCDVSSQMALV
jgi:hypothetical protein